MGTETAGHSQQLQLQRKCGTATTLRATGATQLSTAGGATVCRQATAAGSGAKDLRDVSGAQV